MKIKDTMIVKLLVFALLIGTGASDSHLRPVASPEPNEKASSLAATTTGTAVGNEFHRFLQLDALVLNSLVDLFVPELADEVQNLAKENMDPVDINYSTLEDQGELDLNVNRTFCNHTTAIVVATYAIGVVTGMGTMQVNSLELVPGTANINLPPFSIIPGAAVTTWEGVWDVDANFVNFTAATVATLAKTFCNFTFEESLAGDSVIVSPTATVRIKLEGETNNIYDFQASSQLNAATIQSFTVGYQSIVAQIGTWTDWVTLDADEPLVEIGNEGFAGDIRDLILEQMQNGLNDAMPYSLGG
ncbi:expressed unknown protein [Seminavis robusta]|uniref:Uncharacterized protein n=1 Tax=Seminavis robusta TaxID=568900 RepID=A0A9N8E424_9STRA|nr:expressed unknown protein [Seminavis robusta]|eukprot:Sro522_g159630.1 n/a (302) ;mRNA; r:45875-46780